MLEATEGFRACGMLSAPCPPRLIMNVRKPYELPGTRSKKSSPDSRRYSRCAGVLRAATFARHPPAPATRFCRMAYPRRCGCADSPGFGSVVRFRAHGAARARYIRSEIFSPAHPLCHGVCCGCLRRSLLDRLTFVNTFSNFALCEGEAVSMVNARNGARFPFCGLRGAMVRKPGCAGLWHPSGVRVMRRRSPGVSSQAPQPPANFYQPFGLGNTVPG